MNVPVLVCLLLWPCLKQCVASNHKNHHESTVKITNSSRGRQGKRDQTPIFFTDNGPGKFVGIEADSLGLKKQATLSPNIAKETVLKELDDESEAVFDHDSDHPSKTKDVHVGTESNDISQYDDEDINLVSSPAPSSRPQVPKPVHLPSLTHEGRMDTVVTKTRKIGDVIKMHSPKVAGSRPSGDSIVSSVDSMSSGGEDNSLSKSTDSMSSVNENKPVSLSSVSISGGMNRKSASKNADSESVNDKVKNVPKSTGAMARDKKENPSTRTASESLKGKDSSSKKAADSGIDIFNLSDSTISESSSPLPKSASQFLGESDASSTDKLRKFGERLSTFYDHDINVVKKATELPNATAVPEIFGNHSNQTQAAKDEVNVKGGQIGGGQITGGNILGGDVEGGFIGGGTVKGGNIRGGRMTGGVIDGGVLLYGTVEGGFVHNGTIKGGDVKGGNVTGGIITGGVIFGGHVSGGAVEGGVLKKGGVEGGVLRGGTIDGGVLKGGVMESGQLLGGTVWNGRVTGGTILGGEVLGGEVGEGVVIRGGRINGSVTVGRSTGAHLFLSKSAKESGATSTPASPGHTTPSVAAIGGVITTKHPPSHSTPIEHWNSILAGKTESGAVVVNTKTPNVVVLSNISRPEDEMKRTYESKVSIAQRLRPSSQRSFAFSNPVRNYAQQSFAGERSGFSGVNYARTTYSATRTATNVAPNHAASTGAATTFLRPLAVAVPRSVPAGININQFVKQVSSVPRSWLDNAEVKPDHHWILNNIKDGEVIGNPGRKLVANGGIRLNRASIGFDGTATFMDGGDYAGSCVSDPNVCPKGLSVEMTIKVHPEATNYRDPRYILDTGASSFNSRGVALYTMDNKLRADVAVWDKAYCLVVPLTTGKWQDVFLTYNKDGELNMYINCKLAATTESDEQCIICHTPGCHTTDKNTKLMLGRANNEPQSGFAKFKAGDLSFYEKYLNPQDIDRICGFTKQKPSLAVRNVMPSSLPWRSPVLSSSVLQTQPGFSKSSISNPRKDLKTLPSLPYFSPWSSWSICSSTCGPGSQVRQRSCIYTHAQSGWQTCHGVTFQAKKCSMSCRGQREGSKANTLSRRDEVVVGQNHRTRALKSSTYSTPKVNVESTDLKSKNIMMDKQKNPKNDTDSKLITSRRSRIGRILSKLGNLLRKL